MPDAKIGRASSDEQHARVYPARIVDVSAQSETCEFCVQSVGQVVEKGFRGIDEYGEHESAQQSDSHYRSGHVLAYEEIEKLASSKQSTYHDRFSPVQRVDRTQLA